MATKVKNKLSAIGKTSANHPAVAVRKLSWMSNKTRESAKVCSDAIGCYAATSSTWLNPSNAYKSSYCRRSENNTNRTSVTRMEEEISWGSTCYCASGVQDMLDDKLADEGGQFAFGTSREGII